MLRLAARGPTTRAIADQLYISPKTADHHIQHVYSRPASRPAPTAALWAMENAILD